MKRWFQNLKVAHKLMLIGIFFVIPDGVMFYFFITGINANIEFARKEQRGNAYQRPLADLLEFIPQHSLAACRVKQGEPGAAGELAAKASQITAALDALAQADAQHGIVLQFTDDGLSKRGREQHRVTTLKRDWESLAQELSSLDAAVSKERHAHLVASVRVMITHAGDLSNLILDPDLDSYYLMDATLLALPQMQDRLGGLMLHAVTEQRESPTAAANRHACAVYATLLKEADFDRVVRSLETALNEDANFHGTSLTLQPRLAGAIAVFKTAANRVIQLADRAGREGGNARELADGASAARDASFQLWRIAVEELNALLGARIAEHRTRRSTSLIVAGFALLAAIGFVSFITRSISGPLRRQAEELRVANENVRTEVAEQKRIQQALRAAEEKYRSIFENSVEGIFQTTPDGQYLVANPTLARIYGYKSVDEMEASITDISGRLYVDPLRRLEFMRQIARNGVIHRFESQIYRKDGSIIWISENARAVNDAEGNPLYYEGTVMDITAQKETEAKLKQVNKQLVDASRRAGMADVATGVLHNVGNVLNSVNVAAMLMADRLGKSRVTHLTSVAGLLREHAADLGEFFSSDARGKKLPAFIGSLSERLNVEQAELLRELEGLAKNVAHIKEIVSVQQSYAKVSGVVETLALPDLVEDALEMNDAAFDRHGVDVTREFEAELPNVTLDKHKVLQVLINVIGNAKHAVSECSRPDKKIVVRVTTGADRVRIAVSDNGIGIPGENLSRIFAHGFTTKSDGHGFGLHSAALAAAELGGALLVASDGPGRGATFTLEIPMNNSRVPRAEQIALAN